jgi:hypothetical protein
LYDVLFLITKGKAHGLITTDSMEALSDGRLALVMINEVVSPFDHHRVRELTQAVAMMQISAKEKKMTQGWVVNGVRRHAEPLGDNDPPQLC